MTAGDYVITFAQAHGADAIVSDRNPARRASGELQVLAPRALATA